MSLFGIAIAVGREDMELLRGVCFIYIHGPLGLKIHSFESAHSFERSHSPGSKFCIKLIRSNWALKPNESSLIRINLSSLESEILV